MSEPVYFEDSYLEFYRAMTMISSFDDEDQIVADDFLNLVLQDKAFTKKQALYLRKIMLKYKDQIQDIFDVEQKLKDCIWKNPFRVLDQERKIFLEKEDGVYWVHFKFPYFLKSLFESTFSEYPQAGWDRDKKTRKIALYQSNLIKILEFAKENQFIVDEQLLAAEALYDEIAEQRSQIESYTSVLENSIQLKNCSDDTLSYFNDHRTGQFYEDLLLSKKMGLIFVDKLEVPLLDTIFSSRENIFRIGIADLLQFYNIFQQRIYVAVEKSCDYITWTMNFVNLAEHYGIEKSKIKICFREKNKDNKEFNDWIKSNGLGGPIKDEKIFIFLSLPAKWIFKDKDNLATIATNWDYSRRYGIANSYVKSSGLAFILEGKK